MWIDWAEEVLKKTAHQIWNQLHIGLGLWLFWLVISLVGLWCAYARHYSANASRWNRYARMLFRNICTSVNCTSQKEMHPPLTSKHIYIAQRTHGPYHQQWKTWYQIQSDVLLLGFVHRRQITDTLFEPLLGKDEPALKCHRALHVWIRWKETLHLQVCISYYAKVICLRAACSAKVHSERVA